MLTLQTGRYLLSLYKTVSNDKKKVPVQYMNDLARVQGSRVREKDIVGLESISLAFDNVCANLTSQAGKPYLDALKRGATEDAALELVALQRFKAAKAHCQGFLFHRFRAAISSAPPGLQQVLGDLCQLYGLYTITEHAGPFLQYGYYKPEHMTVIQQTIYALLDKIRPQVVPLSDAFNYTDYVVNSPLGCYDGDVYRRYFEIVTRQNPPGKPHPYYATVMKPVLLRQPDGQGPDSEPLRMSDEEILGKSQQMIVG